MSDAHNVKDLQTLKKDADDFERIVSDIRNRVEALKDCNAKMGRNWQDVQYHQYRSECEQFLPLVVKFLDSSQEVHTSLEEHIKKLKAANTFV